MEAIVSKREGTRSTAREEHLPSMFNRVLSVRTPHPSFHALHVNILYLMKLYAKRKIPTVAPKLSYGNF